MARFADVAHAVSVFLSAPQRARRSLRVPTEDYRVRHRRGHCVEIEEPGRNRGLSTHRMPLEELAPGNQILKNKAGDCLRVGASHCRPDQGVAVSGADPARSRDSVRPARGSGDASSTRFPENHAEEERRPLAGFDAMHPDAVDLGRMVSNVHGQELYFPSSPATCRNSSLRTAEWELQLLQFAVHSFRRRGVQITLVVIDDLLCAAVVMEPVLFAFCAVLHVL